MAQTKKAKKNPQNYMTASEADRAIYIDLEGFTGKSPALIGVLMDDDFEQIVLDDRLTSAATAKKLRTSSLAEEIQRLQLCCAETDRVLVAYSLHELNVIREHALIDVGDIYRNGRKLATRFKTLVLPNVAVKDRGLKTFLKLIGFTIPKGLEAGQATQWLGYVTDMIQRRGSYAKLTRVAKGKWTKLLGYNEYDCRGLKALVLHATKELESYSAPKKKPKAKELKPKKAIVKLSTPSNVIASPPEQIITRKKQKAAVRAYIRYVWNSESSEASKKYVCFPYQIHHDPGDPYEGNELTEQDFARWHKNTRANFQAAQYEIQDLLCSKRTVTATWLWRGQYSGYSNSEAPKNKVIRASGATVFYFKGNRISGHWQVVDRLSIHRQLGNADKVPFDFRCISQ